MGEVPIKRTPWGTPGDHHSVAVNMFSFLRARGEPDHVAVKVTAHAIVASGWRQKCYNHNAWGVKRGKGWDGDYYRADTKEEINGVVVDVPGDSWRAFPSFSAAADDYFKRISAGNSRYHESARVLRDAQATGGDFWIQLGKDGYYTTTQFSGADFESVCRRVRKEIAAGAPFESARPSGAGGAAETAATAAIVAGALAFGGAAAIMVGIGLLLTR